MDVVPLHVQMLYKSVHIYSLKENKHNFHIYSGYLYLVTECPQNFD